MPTSRRAHTPWLASTNDAGAAAMMRRGVVVVVLTGAALFFASRFSGPESAALPSVEAVATVAAPPATTTTVGSVRVTPPQAPAPTTSTSTSTTIPIPTVTEGGEVFEGGRIYTNWGWVKVEITVVDGVMVDIEMVMLPRKTKRSEALTREYEPIMREQALTTQDSDVDVIAGATVISYGYSASLSKALISAGLRVPSQ